MCPSLWKSRDMNTGAYTSPPSSTGGETLRIFCVRTIHAKETESMSISSISLLKPIITFSVSSLASPPKNSMPPSSASPLRSMLPPLLRHATWRRRLLLYSFTLQQLCSWTIIRGPPAPRHVAPTLRLHLFITQDVTYRPPAHRRQHHRGIHPGIASQLP